MPKKVADAYLKQGMTDDASRALMRFLGQWSKKTRSKTGEPVGEYVYLVGGAPRNLILGLDIKDLDLVVDSIAMGHDSEWVARQLMLAIPAKCNLATNNYGVAILTVTEDWFLGSSNLRGENIEIANARSESYGGSGGKGYKPSEVQPATIEQDVLRREFRTNTLLMKLISVADKADLADIIDLTGCGVQDIKEGVLRCPMDPDITFRDDPSRMIRAVKFYCKYNLKADKETETSIRRNAPFIKKVPYNAISDLLIHTLLVEPTAKKALLEMKRLGLLDVVAEMVTEIPAFRATLAGWSNNQRLGLLFDLLDLGVPLNDRIKFLSAEQQRELQRILPRLKSPEAFLDALKQPAKVADFPRLIKELSLKGPQIGVLTSKARDFLLEDPSLFDRGLTERLLRDHA
jgi:tRNA nucleotidyltransferase/poly(A) polymerase